jgi:hypothetical protein
MRVAANSTTTTAHAARKKNPSIQALFQAFLLQNARQMATFPQKENTRPLARWVLHQMALRAGGHRLKRGQ